MMKKRILSLLCVLALCLGLLPVTALAAEGAPNTLYVGNQNVKSGGDTTYWTTDPSTGELTQYTESGDAWNVKYDPNSNTLTLNGATITGRSDSSVSKGAGIYALCSSNNPVSLTIELIGTNTIKGSYGIYVEAQQGGTVGTNASLLIQNSGDDGSLEVSGSSYGIYVNSGTGNASLTIKDVSVVASSSSSYDGNAGVCVQSGSFATSSPQLSLAVNGGSLTASGGGNNDGILFYVGSSSDTTNATTSLTVSDNAIVRANGGIKASRVDEPTPSGTGIVFDGTEGTVYGNVTLDESLTINQGETLTIPEGSTLNTNNNLTNNGTIVNTGGTLNGEPGGIIVTAPAITTESLPEGTVNQLYSATLEVTGNNITWSLDSGTLPDGLTLDSNGTIVGTPTAAGTSTFTVTATNNIGSDSREFTLKIEEPAFIPVTDLELNKGTLTLQEKDSDTLTVTVKPADATNQDVTWESSDTSIATVSEDGTVTAISAGNATITATAADGSGISASCTLTVTHGNMVQTPKKDATCTVDGTEEYWTCGICGKHFKDENGTEEIEESKWIIPATGHSYGDDGHCMACGAVDSDFAPAIISGANAAWHKGSEDRLSFASNAAFADFLKVQVDGKDVDSSNYAVKEGSTIVTLNASYLETLSVGKHTLAIVSDTGTAETEFTVLAAEEEAADNKTANDSDKESLAKTSDGSMLPIAALSILTVASIVVGALALRRSRI